MKVSLLSNGIIVIPETEFEAAFLRKIDLDNAIVFHKCGISSKDYVGLKIKERNETNETRK